MEHRIIKQTLFEDPPLDNPGGWVTGVGDLGAEMFNKRFCNVSVISDGFGGEGDRFIERDFCSHVVEGFNDDEIFSIRTVHFLSVGICDVVIDFAVELDYMRRPSRSAMSRLVS